MNKMLIVCGPTATGKTKLAINLAKKFNGELISADSRQVYKGMDIGTGKDISKNSKLKTPPAFARGKQNLKIQINNKNYSIGYHTINKIPIWLLDIVLPNQNFSVAEYQYLARKVLGDIWTRNKLPILVGGTGLYIKAIVNGIDTIGIPIDWKLRKKLEKYSLNDLQKQLQSLNKNKWEKMNNSDKNNPRRLIRAIEISMYLNKKGKSFFKKNQKKEILDTLIIGLKANNNILFKKINDRVEKRVKEGIKEEIKSLLNKGYSWDLPSMSGLGYRVWKDFFEKVKTEKETIEKWKIEEQSYVKRQMTWFKKDNRINWFNIENPDHADKVGNNISIWINNK